MVRIYSSPFPFIKSLNMHIYLKIFPFSRKVSWTHITTTLTLVIKERFFFMALTKMVEKAGFTALL